MPTIKGKIYRILPTNTKEFNGKTYTDRDVVLDCSTFDQFSGERRENNPCINFFGNKCTELDNFAPGQDVEITFSLNGRKYNDKTTKIEKYFTKVAGYKIEHCDQQPVQSTTTYPPTQQSTLTPQSTAAEDVVFEKEEDDLPF